MGFVAVREIYLREDSSVASIRHHRVLLDMAILRARLQAEEAMTDDWHHRKQCFKAQYLWMAIVALVVMFVSGPAQAQPAYRSGQVVSPAYEGWEEDPDGSLYFLFGYMNSNWEEEPVVPVGPENYIRVIEAGTNGDTFQATGADQGQPTRFQPRRNRFVFRVPVPDGFTGDDELIWRLMTRGEAVTAYATLALDYKVDGLIKASEQGALGAGTSSPAVRANKAPELRLEGPATRTARVGSPLELVAIATDDDVPRRTESRCHQLNLATGLGAGQNIPCGWDKPRQITVGSATGLRLSWYVYRGAGAPIFKPDQAKTWEDTRVHANSPWAQHWSPPPIPEDGRYVTEVTFHEPGTYVLRCLASDGALGVDADVTVTVTE